MKLEWIKLDDVPVKYKFIWLFIFSVLIPVIITNYIFYISIDKNVEMQQIADVKSSVERIRLNLANNIDNCLGVSDVIYTDYNLNSLMEKNYNNEDEYYVVFDTYLRNSIIKYLPLYNQISNINLYVDNNTIVNGSGYFHLNQDAVNSVWYKNAINSKNNTTLFSYFDMTLLSLPNKDSGRMISILKKLDNFKAMSKYTKLLKVDLNYGSINNILKNEKFKGNIYVVNQYNKVIFSNNSKFLMETSDYLQYDKSQINNNDICFDEELEGIFSGWRLITTVSRANIMGTILNSNKYILVLILINLFIPSIMILIISRSFNNRLALVSKQINKVENQDFVAIECNEGKDEIGQLITRFNRMTSTIGQLIEDVYQASIQKKNSELARKQAELNMLQSQINPHFLFNTLETIRMRSLIKKEIETSEIIMHLAKMLRRSLAWEDDFVSISDEISLTKDFLSIQKYRFGNKLNYDIHVEKDVDRCMIPKLSILTFVENSCIHGIENIEKEGKIDISVSIIGNKLEIKISDNGIGIPKQKIDDLKAVILIQSDIYNINFEGKNIGIKNVYARLNIFYGDDLDFTITSEEKQGTIVRILIPLDDKKVQDTVTK